MTSESSKPGSREFWIASMCDNLAMAADVIVFKESYTKGFDASFVHVIEMSAYTELQQSLAQITAERDELRFRMEGLDK